MASEQGLRIGPQAGLGRLEVRDRTATPDDGEVLAAVLDRVEDVSEVPGGFSRTHFRHNIRLSDVATTASVPVPDYVSSENRYTLVSRTSKPSFR